MGEIKTNKLTILTLVFLILTSVSCIVTAKEIFVQPGNSIQNSINNAAPDDIITVKPGIYTENIKITEDNLTIRSESENPDDTIIKAKSKTAHVFLLQADKVKIKGFKISGSILYGYAGICLSSCSDCMIEDNKLSNNSFGIYLLNSKSNIISKNAVSENQRGIYLNISENNTLSGNNATNNREYGIASQNSNGSLLSENLVFKNERGIYFGRSDGNTLTGNTVRNNNVYGLYICGASDRNAIYNNYFNDTSMTIKNGTGNAYNITRTASTNIIGGPYIGGNYWAKPDGTGFSQTAADKDGNGISDSAYTRIAGSKYSDYLPLVIIPEPPEPVALVANFWGSPRSGDVPLNVTFTDISTETPTEWNWSFGDGTYSNQQNPVHIYSEAGNYTVTLTASNAAGSDTIPKNNYITALQKPDANFWGSPRSGNAPLKVAFTDISKGSPTAWNWSFGDGTYSTQQNPEHIYSAAGSSTVKLIASNEAGMGTIIKNNYINITAPQKPITDFWGSPRSGNGPLNVTFTDNTTGMPTAWSWNFGDGAYSTVKSPTHMYSAAGNYTATLTASNTAGSNTKTKTNYINVEKALEKPVANFWGSPRSGNLPLNVTFTDNSTEAPTAWNWSFGDGTYSTVKSPKHTYSTAGNYTVILTVNNKAGNGTITKYNYISAIALQKPVANFWGSPRSGSAPLRTRCIID